jgi:hypothetical protein
VDAFGDGTIRWCRYSDGRELAAFFLNADQRRWVLWTPSGYYDASPGGEELIGWHVNNGPDKEADFFPASRFRSLKYRPDGGPVGTGSRDRPQTPSRCDPSPLRHQQGARHLGRGRSAAPGKCRTGKGPGESHRGDYCRRWSASRLPNTAAEFPPLPSPCTITVRTPSGEPVTGAAPCSMVAQLPAAGA